MSQPMTCSECNGSIKVTIEASSVGKMVIFTCRKCGIKYDTRLNYGNEREEANE